MKTSSKSEKTKAWRIEKTGNPTVAIYRRDKFHKLLIKPLIKNAHAFLDKVRTIIQHCSVLLDV